MAKRVITTATYQGNAHDIFLEALDFGAMCDAMSGLAHYEGLPRRRAQEGETISVDITTLKIFKFTGYQMFFEHLDTEACVLQSREKGGFVKMWDHNLSIQQVGKMAIWTDDVTIDAGLVTPIIARFAAYMYSRRHKYRKALSLSTQVKSISA